MGLWSMAAILMFGSLLTATALRSWNSHEQ
jgi:hypothetical protein